MYLYDKAHELAAEIKKSPEFLEYKKLKDEIFVDATTKDLVNQYKSLQIEGQAAILSGQQPGQELLDKLKKLGEVLAFNQKVTEYFAAEYKIHAVYSGSMVPRLSGRQEDGNVPDSHVYHGSRHQCAESVFL